MNRAVAASGVQVASVDVGSPAARAGIRAGDTLLAIDGLIPRDLIDVRVATVDRDRVVLDIVRGARRRRARIGLDGLQLGLELTQPTGDGIRECNNNCEFCFIRGLPKGLRRTLYVRDDDYRYSFLFGSYLTLTNLSERDWRRIEYQRLTPLRVSVHATDPAIRARMLAHPGAEPILDQLARLGRAGIRVHCQVVVCPGVNDGAVLDRTLDDLVALDHVVTSVAVVPVGVSDHMRTTYVRRLETDEAARVLDQALRRNRACRRALGRGVVFPSDELFLMAGRSLPAARFYEDYPQLQNGVGLTSVMLADWRRHRRLLPVALAAPRRVAWLCGMAARGALTTMAEDANRVENLHVRVIPVVNTLFGSSIGVSGLMSGVDAARELRGLDVDVAVLPRSAFGHEGARTLDDWSVEQIERESGVAVRLGRSGDELIRLTIG
jgi:putative radical SAM enzyme (TIGR03279 family)